GERRRTPGSGGTRDSYSTPVRARPWRARRAIVPRHSGGRMRRDRARTACAALLALLAAAPGAADESLRVPTVDDLLTLRLLRGAEISPDGRYVAVTATETDFE